jgi:hypothetical protein
MVLLRMLWWSGKITDPSQVPGSIADPLCLLVNCVWCYHGTYHAVNLCSCLPPALDCEWLRQRNWVFWLCITWPFDNSPTLTQKAFPFPHQPPAKLVFVFLKHNKIVLSLRSFAYRYYMAVFFSTFKFQLSCHLFRWSWPPLPKCDSP